MNIEHQIIGSGLRAIAEEMGAVLIRSAFSANIKERRDCSTALFDDRGRMVVRSVRPGDRGARAGSGNDEQRHARERALHVLRDDRRCT